MIGKISLETGHPTEFVVGLWRGTKLTALFVLSSCNPLYGVGVVALKFGQYYPGRSQDSHTRALHNDSVKRDPRFGLIKLTPFLILAASSSEPHVRHSLSNHAIVYTGADTTRSPFPLRRFLELTKKPIALPGWFLLSIVRLRYFDICRTNTFSNVLIN